MPRSTAILIAMIAGLAAVGCQATAPADDESARPSPARLRVFVSILPQAYFLERLGGERVEVDVLVGPGQSPETYEVTPKQVARLTEARAFFRIGVPFEESLLKKIASTVRQLEIVDTRQGIPLRVMEHSHHHGEHDDHDQDDADAEAPNGGAAAGDHGHSHGSEAGRQTDREAPSSEAAKGDDPHIWLSPRLVRIQAKTICDALVRLDPEHGSEYLENLKRFEDDLDGVDRKLTTVLEPLRGREFFVFHPAYGYFADAYGLRQTPVEIEGKEPGPKQLIGLIEKARKAGVKVIFVQPQFSTTAAETVARSIGGAVVPMDPLARDYLANLTAMAEKIRLALNPSEASKDENDHDHAHR
ncbi:MAG TPA: zinc ABC transporter substrate-binding protein [Phycisphaerae bacterium]|nr:zinc ABC transporter substrate-binding protein [Phycisphaerae bacterium]